MQDYIVSVVMLHGGCRNIHVINANSYTHARLVAYYYVYGAENPPTLECLKELTLSVPINGGPVNAQIYKNHLE